MTPPVLDADAVFRHLRPRPGGRRDRGALAGGLDPAADPPRLRVPLAAGELLLMASEGARVGLKVVEDPAAALREAGDVCLAIDEGALRERDLVPMRDVVTGRTVPDPRRTLLFKSVGVAWQDLVVAEAVLGGHHV